MLKLVGRDKAPIVAVSRRISMETGNRRLHEKWGQVLTISKKGCSYPFRGVP
ncbi:hypothetical protein Plhal304r1_c061g0148491 [Plasmopara halstedii]